MVVVGLGSREDEALVRGLHPQHPSLMTGDGWLMAAKETGEAGEAGRLIGFAWTFERDIPAPVGKVSEAFMNVIAVEDGFQGKGIGSRIVQACIQKAGADGCYQLRAYCDIHNAASHRLWLKNGFGISPVAMPDGTTAGSFVTYTLGRGAPAAPRGENQGRSIRQHE